MLTGCLNRCVAMLADANCAKEMLEIVMLELEMYVMLMYLADLIKTKAGVLALEEGSSSVLMSNKDNLM